MQELYKYFQDFYKEAARKHFYVCIELINNLELIQIQISHYGKVHKTNDLI